MAVFGGASPTLRARRFFEDVLWWWWGRWATTGEGDHVGSPLRGGEDLDQGAGYCFFVVVAEGSWVEEDFLFLDSGEDWGFVVS